MPCACGQGAPTLPGTIDEPFDEPDIFIEILSEPECGDDLDCGPLLYCDGFNCVETTECVEHIDCHVDWPDEPRFCVDGLCKPIGCVEDLQCPDVALCDEQCQWIEVLPDCVNVPSFEVLLVDTLVTPEAAAVVILDLDVDGRDDWAVIDDGALHWVPSTGVGFAAPIPWAADPGTQPIGLGRADIHGDGVDELLVGHEGVLGIEILTVSGAGPQHADFVETFDAPTVPTAIDVDYDGLPDLVSGTATEGPTTLIEAQLGDGTGTFASLWTDDVEPFDWVGPFAALDRVPHCTRAVGSSEMYFLGVRYLDRDGVQVEMPPVFSHPTAGQMIFAEMPTRPAGILATAAHADRGALFLYQAGQPDELFIELSPEPSEVALASPGGSTHLAIIDQGAEPAEFVEFSGSPLEPVCRGSLGFVLDVEQLGVGDFDGDGREDLLGRGSDGVVRVWYSRD